MKYWYIQIKDNGIVEFETPLDAESFEIGTTFADYEAGKWVLLSPEQVAFHEAHPDATIKEVFEMQLDPGTKQPEPDELTIARKQKLLEIEEQDNFSNKFFVSVTQGGIEIANVELWIDKDLRNSLYSITLPALLSDGETETTLWSTSTPPQPLKVPISWAMKNIPVLEIYAKRTYDLFASNTAAAYAAMSEDELAQIDVKKDYPIFLTFELNLDLNGNSN